MTHTEIDYSKLRPTDWLPTSVKEMKALGWDSVDVVIFSGDAYVDHPAFGAAVTTCATSASSAFHACFSVSAPAPWTRW